MYFYDTNNSDGYGTRGFTMTVQGTDYSVSWDKGVYVAGIKADASGVITGNMVWTGGQASWSGFQLDEVPEPSTLLLLPAAVALLAAVRRRSR